jgi:hypothetical protein
VALSSGTLGYLPRITMRAGRAIEEALAPATLLDNGARLGGAVIEASYALRRPPLLKRLRVVDVTRRSCSPPRALQVLRAPSRRTENKCRLV